MAQGFEFDARKSEANRDKHGVAFEQAQMLWEDPRAVELATTFSGEKRRLLVGTMGDRIWTVVFTRRDGRIRIISMRRARKAEVDAYEGQ